MAKKAITGNIEEKIEKAVDLIVDSIEFGIAYGRYVCFRRKVNEEYNIIISADPEIFAKKKFSRTIEDTSKLVVRAAIRVWRESLQKSQVWYKQCLENLQAQNQFETTGQNQSGHATEIMDPPVGDSGPFDRRLDRLMLTDQENGYRNIIPYDTRYTDAGTLGFNMNVDMVKNSEVPNKDEIALGIAATNEGMRNDPYFMGVQSVVNTYSITKLYGSESGELLVDKKGQRRWYEVNTTQDGRLAYSLNPTTTSIINWGEGDPYGRTPYHFSDFVFSKYWNIVPNNRMITLRRFAAPIVDNLKFPGMDGFTGAGTPSEKSDDNQTDAAGNDLQNLGGSGESKNVDDGITEDQGSGKKISFPPMATAITYFGEETNNQLSDILKFTTGFNWGEVESNVFEVGTNSNPDMESGPAGLFGGLGSMARMLNIGTGNFDSNAMMNEGQLPPDPYIDGPYENRIIGPVNAITKVKKRERGLQYENKISLTFEYVARPIGGVNTKAVLLDIISNFLVIGSATAMFWGGQHRFMGQPQRYPFIGGDKGIQQWYRGDPLAWGQTSIDQFAGQIVGSGGILDMAKNFFSSLLGGGGGGDRDIMGGLKNVMSGDNLASNIIRARAAEKSKGAIPYLTGLKALLIGEPVGEWHITIGNPLNPIAMIGNLICDNIEVEFGNELGPDDFPLDVKIIVNLEHAMARDRDAIQSMFNRGMGRIYDLPDAMAGSADYETKVDDFTGNQSKTGRSPSDWRSGTVIGGAATSGGATGPSRVRENALQGNASVWNKAKFNSMSPNQFTEFGTRNNPQNIWARSEFRATSWVGLKSLK